ncbi:hypothetical protein VOLCADRAFT_91711 [Volvox carteri f. nagariensis]|uniref:Uncharacterized protein n=1 Tax=Volvox carteri f. nagariensis TaxID=3068 RepID=D8TXS9_VOLCA|nr:uncharacterized protein VOLCADRAFT_91711 [Volvox carteri f. nagariensis]EFJ47694.1 hypothetical protein VOLCADRAFT_91711 [Volvox carteri f. nagariensis]|eukprot:XP_002951165.1 hypothetical protein VOLCADRAFT_91711 [Volvox carteri f. nagariensis]
MVGEKRRPACLPERPCYFVRPFRATVLFRIGNQQAADGLAWVTLAPRLTQRNIPRASKPKAGLSPSQENKVRKGGRATLYAFILFSAQAKQPAKSPRCMPLVTAANMP